MIEYNDEYDAYVIEFDDVIVCWDEEPDDSCDQAAEDIRAAYNRSIKHIAKAICEELGSIFGAANIDDVIAKLGRPQIYPDSQQAVYCEHSLDDYHIISFEYSDDDFSDIEYVSIDG